MAPAARRRTARTRTTATGTRPSTCPVEREAKNKIDAVNKYLQGKEGTITPKLWEDIIAVLQGLLDDPADKFVEIDGKGNKVSVKKEVNRIIGTFDDDGRQFYQRIVGPTADQRFKQAKDENDMLLMAEVATRYLHTKAGADATLRIGTWHLDRGRYAQAANAFRMFALRNPKDELPPRPAVQGRPGLQAAGRVRPDVRQGGQRYWDLFEKASNKGQVTIENRTFTYDQLKAEYDKAVPARRSSAASGACSAGTRATTASARAAPRSWSRGSLTRRSARRRLH